MRVADEQKLVARHVSPGVPTVLLVSDDQDDRGMYAEYLRLRGCLPLEAATTDEALRRVLDADAIVTDVRVAGSCDGLEFVRRVRSDQRTHAKPVIVLTSWVFDPSREEALAAGCDVFLTKPCLPESLVLEIRRLVGARPDPRLHRPTSPQPRARRRRRRR
jgi:CheY-like chemotaxis protein